jgi:hypothetical protein
VRFIHPNRQCPEHRDMKLVRDGKQTLRTHTENLPEVEIEWFEKYVYCIICFDFLKIYCKKTVYCLFLNFYIKANIA